jgi:2'-5' RNA ligase
MEPQYAVVAFPALAGADSVEAVRRRFDPLSALLAAHVTLVFPFRDDHSEASLADHVGRAVERVPPFALSLSGLSVETGGYLLLDVDAGADRFHDLHARLYSGPLARHRSSAHEYRPHVTVGRLVDHQGVAEARQEAYLALRLPVLGTVSGLAIFRLDGPDRGAIVCRVAFDA